MNESEVGQYEISIWSFSIVENKLVYEAIVAIDLILLDVPDLLHVIPDVQTGDKLKEKNNEWHVLRESDWAELIFFKEISNCQ